MRKHIGDAIARRSKAVRNAVDKYNKLAPIQKPPRPIIQYSAVAAYSWLGEFELLKESRQDVLEKPWAVQTNREMMTKFYKLRRAHEEILRCNIEARRLSTWVRDEDNHLLDVLEGLRQVNRPLAAALDGFRAERHRINNIHRARLHTLFRMSGFSGFRTPGISIAYGEKISVRSEVAELEEEGAVSADMLGQGIIEVNDDDVLQDEANRYSDVLQSHAFEI